MQSPQELFQIYKRNPKEEALINLLQSLQPIIYAVCFKVVKNESDSHDVTQNVLLKLIRDIHQLKDVKVILGWVHQIAFYTALEFKREQIKQRTLSQKKTQVEHFDSSDDTSLVIHEHIQKLDKESQQLILLKFFDNKTFEEINQITGKAYSSAHYEIQKILSSLKNSLEKAGYFSVASGLELSLSSPIQLPSTNFILNTLIKKELKKVVFKKVSFGLTTILVAASALVLVGVAIIVLPQKEDSKVLLADKAPTKTVALPERIDKAVTANLSTQPLKMINESTAKNELNIKEPEIDFIPEDKVELKPDLVAIEKQKKEALPGVIKKLCFADELGKELFGGRSIPLQEGNVDFGQGTQINIVKGSQGAWLVGLVSKEYYLNKLQYDMTRENKGTYLIFTGVAEINTVFLSAYSIIKINLESKENFLLKDDLLCHLIGFQKITSSESRGIKEEVIIKNNSATYFISNDGTVTIEKVFLGSYVGNLYKAIELKHGETIELKVNLEKAQEQIFQLLDSELRPLEDYYVVFTEDSFHNDLSGIDLKVCVKTFKETGSLTVSEYIGKTDKNGMAKTIRHFIKEKEILECLVLGKNHKPQKFSISSENVNKTIELKLSNYTQVQIKTFLNNEPYLEDISFVSTDSPWINNETHKKYSAQRLRPVEILSNNDFSLLIKNGILILEDLPPAKFKFRIDSNKFNRDEFIIDLGEKDKLEISIHLKPAEYFVHGIIRDKQGNPKPSVGVGFYYDNVRYKILTDEKGYFKFSGMESNKTCDINIDFEGIVETDLAKSFKASNEEIIIIVDDKKSIPLTVIGLDGKPLLEYEYVLYIYLNGRSFANFMLGGIAKNGALNDKVEAYGIFHFEIKVPNAPTIILDWPILKAEDVVPKTVYASLGFTLNGIVNDVNGNPIENIIITQDEHIQLPFKSVKPIDVTTNKEGKFKIEKCALGKSYWFLKEGYSPIHFDVKDENKSGEVKIVLLSSRTIKGKFLSLKNEPYLKPRVTGYCRVKNKYSYEIIGDIKEDGSFIVEGLSQDKWEISFSLAGRKDYLTKEIHVLENNEDLNVVYDFKPDEK